MPGILLWALGSFRRFLRGVLYQPQSGSPAALRARRLVDRLPARSPLNGRSEASALPYECRRRSSTHGIAAGRWWTIVHGG
jgi:hypothetical protein